MGVEISHRLVPRREVKISRAFGHVGIDFDEGKGEHHGAGARSLHRSLGFLSLLPVNQAGNAGEPKTSPR